MGYKVAVVGATGNVGREVLQIMAEREFPADEVVALASARSVGREISYGEDQVLKVQNLETFDFRGTDIVLSSPGAKVSAKYSPIAAEAGADFGRAFDAGKIVDAIGGIVLRTDQAGGGLCGVDAVVVLAVVVGDVDHPPRLRATHDVGGRLELMHHDVHPAGSGHGCELRLARPRPAGLLP